MEFQAVNKNYSMTENQACAGKQKNSIQITKKPRFPGAFQT